MRIGILERRLFVWVLGLCGLVGLTAGMWMAHTEENRLVADAETRLRLLSRRYASELEAAAGRKLKVALSANAIVGAEIAAPYGSADPPAPRRGADGAVRVADSQSGAFLGSGSPLTDETAALFERTERLWPLIAPLVATEFANFGLVAESGFARFSPPGPESEVAGDHDFRLDPPYQLAAPERNPERTPVWTPVYYDEVGKRWVATLAVPLYDGDRFIGVTRGDVTLEEVAVWAGDLSLREGWGNAFLFDEAGNLIAHQDYTVEILARAGAANERLDAQPVEDAGLKALIDGVLAGRVAPRWPVTADLKRAPHFVCVEPASSLRWYVAVQVSQADVAARADALRAEILAAAFGLGVLLAIVLSLGFRRTVSRPVTGLALAADALARGEWDHPIEARATDDEIGRLGLALREMADRLRASFEAMRESEERYRVLFESSGEGVLMVGLDETVLMANPAAGAIFGLDARELIGRNLLEFVVEDDHAEVLRQTDLRKQGVTSSYELRLVGAKGDAKRVVMTVTPTEWREGALIGCTAICRDITEARRLEERIQHAQKLESMALLAGGIAHDFNNLLMGVLGNASLALMELGPDDPARGWVERIEVAAKRAGELSRQMLAYSGKGRFVVQKTDLSRLVDEMAHLLAAASSKNVSLEMDLAEGLPLVECDATEIRQVAMNLITNASEALGGAPGVVRISTRAVEVDRDYLLGAYTDHDLPTGCYVCLEVSDTGCGMDRATRDRLFEPFFSTKPSGRGLGMAAVLGIVRGHRGAIRVYSEPGLGTRIRVLLPAVEREGEAEAAASTGLAEAERAWTSDALVLIADDEATVREVARSTVELAGMEALEAADGLEAVELFLQHRERIAVVLLDMTMPRMDGAEALRQIRRIRPETPVILSSGFTEQDAVSSLPEGDRPLFIQKPYGPLDLLELLAQILGEKPDDLEVA